MIGDMLGPYRVSARLGEGGMGEVYRARDATLERDVAIKVLPPAVAADAERVERFRREARVLASLNHPNIAAIYGFEETPDASFLVLELVEGEDLAARLARGPVPVAEALAIARQIAEALEDADHHLARTHRTRRHPGHRRLHGAGAGPRQACGSPGRHLGVRRAALRVARRTSAVSRRDDDGRHLAGHLRARRSRRVAGGRAGVGPHPPPALSRPRSDDALA